MVCLLACFRTVKHGKRGQLVKSNPCSDKRNGPVEANQPIEFIRKEEIENPIKSITESKKKLEELLKCSSVKKVVLDPNIKAIGKISNEEVKDPLATSIMEKEKEKKEEDPNQKELRCISMLTNVVSYPPNHRYQNCSKSDDDEYEDSNIEKSKSDNDHRVRVQEESSDSLFSLSIESRKQVCEVEQGEKEVNSPMPFRDSTHEELKAVGLNHNARDRSKCVHSVLQPVENLTQWEVVKVRPVFSSKNRDKENVVDVEQDFATPISIEPSFKLSTRVLKLDSDQKQLENQEIAVDTSLSNWLVGSEISSVSKSGANSNGISSPSQKADSLKNIEVRSVFGVLTVEEPKDFSASKSPTPCGSQTHLIGTVGSYWSHTGQTMDSDSGSPTREMLGPTRQYKEEEKEKWNRTPFEARLESHGERCCRSLALLFCFSL